MLVDALYHLCFQIHFLNYQFVMRQVEYVYMDANQRESYNGAICEYRQACQARANKTSNVASSSSVVPLPNRQISNYFMQLRKVNNSFFHIFSP